MMREFESLITRAGCQQKYLKYRDVPRKECNQCPCAVWCGRNPIKKGVKK